MVVPIPPPAPVTATLPFAKPIHRKLTPEEQVNIESYLLGQRETRIQSSIAFDTRTLTNNNLVPAKLVLTPQSENVYSVTRAITRYGVASDEPNKWRYYLDSIEIHLPSSWEQYIAQDNDVELIKLRPFL